MKSSPNRIVWGLATICAALITPFASASEAESQTAQSPKFKLTQACVESGLLETRNNDPSGILEKTAPVSANDIVVNGFLSYHIGEVKGFFALSASGDGHFLSVTTNGSFVKASSVSEVGSGNPIFFTATYEDREQLGRKASIQTERLQRRMLQNVVGACKNYNSIAP